MVAQNSNRLPRVDFLRGIAISCVLILHFSLAYGLDNSPLGTLLSPSLLHAISSNGNYGVTIFFVISGFLITSTSMARWGSLGRIELGAFYLYRFARIMPCLLLALAIIVVLGSLEVPYFDNVSNEQPLGARYFFIGVGSVLTFWHNVLMASSGYFNYCLNVYWSLSVEELFYLLLPLICVFARSRVLIALCACAIVVGPLFRSIHADNELLFMYAYPACFDALAIGCLTALLAPQLPRPWLMRHARALRLMGAACLTGVYLRGIEGHEVFGFTLIALASAVFLLGATDPQARGVTGGRLGAGVRWAGRHSYELYLFHVLVLALMRNLLTKEDLSYGARLPWLLVFLGLSALVAALVAHYVGEPANSALRRSLSRRRAIMA
jgi:peptidoglycan/LPS O-acetylase OafA/YrhL